jgi:Sigma-70, region 4
MNPKSNVAEALESSNMDLESTDVNGAEGSSLRVLDSGMFPVARAHYEAPGDAADVASDGASDGAQEVGGPVVTREQRRSRRKRDVRARTISVKRMTKRELELGRLLYPDMESAERPKKREECINSERPCAYVSCKHHLYLDVSARTGAIKLNFPDLDVWEMKDSCALDISDRGGTTLEEVGAIMNLTRERIRQVEVKGLAKLQALKDMASLRDYIDEGPVGKRRLPVVVQAKDEDEDEDLLEVEAASAVSHVDDLAGEAEGLA